MKKVSKFLISLTISLAVFLIIIIPTLSFAQEWTGLVPCGKGDSTPCDFNDLMVLVDKVIKFILYSMVIPIAAIMFAYAGFLLVTAGGEAAGARTKAKEIFKNTIIGLIIAMAAFLIVKLILSILGYTDAAWIGF